MDAKKQDFWDELYEAVNSSTKVQNATLVTRGCLRVLPDISKFFVRSSGFNEANTVYVKRRRAGVTTGTSVTPPNGITGYGTTSGAAQQIQLGENLPRY